MLPQAPRGSIDFIEGIYFKIKRRLDNIYRGYPYQLLLCSILKSAYNYRVTQNSPGRMEGNRPWSGTGSRFSGHLLILGHYLISLAYWRSSSSLPTASQGKR